MRQLVAVWIVLAALSLPACAQHVGGPVGGAHTGTGGGHAAGIARGSGFQRGVRQRSGGTPQVRSYRAAGQGYGAQRIGGVGEVGNRPIIAGRGLRDGDRDGDDRRFGRGYGRGDRFGRGWGNGGIPYVNPYGYGYPPLYSGLAYAGDLGYGDGGGYDAGANGDDASDNGSGDDSGQGYSDQSPAPYDQSGPQDEGPAGYAGPSGYQSGGGYPATSSNSATGDAGYGQASGFQGTRGYSTVRGNRGSGTDALMDPAGNQATDSSLAASDPVTLVFKDGRPPEKIHNYALTRTTLYVTDAKPQEIPVADLNLEATEKVNRAAGVKFQLPD